MLPDNGEGLAQFLRRIKPINARFVEELNSILRAGGDIDTEKLDALKENARRGWIDKNIEPQWQELAWHITFSSHAQMEYQLKHLIGERRQVRTLILRDRSTGHDRPSIPIFLKGARAVVIQADGTVREIGAGPVSIILRDRLSIDRLRICPVCDRVFWQLTARSETCGQTACSTALGNRKRSKKETTNGNLQTEA